MTINLEIMISRPEMNPASGLVPVPASGGAPASADLRREVLTAAERLVERIASQDLNTQEALRLR
ncbi:MAG TPA: hypothetical protein VIV12_00210, partial [Streptosporangiaceae bacterium]